MRRTLFVKGEYYHIYNRGVEKRRIFLCGQDFERFLLGVFGSRSKESFRNLPRACNNWESLPQKVGFIEDLLRKDAKLVEIVCFCLMSNHYHFLLQELASGGISKFMNRVGDGYVKYFNRRYDRIGPLFCGPFQAIHINRDEYLIYLSRYIHRNPMEFLEERAGLISYAWSSYLDYACLNRWGKGLKTDIILDQFDSHQAEYMRYVEDGVDNKSFESTYLIDS